MKNIFKFLFLGLLICAGYYIYTGGYHNYLTLSYVQTSLAEFKSQDLARPILFKLVYFLAYVLAVALSIPGATILTLLAGALFGVFWGVVLVSFASTIGASIVFLSSRYLLRDWFKEKFSEKYSTINSGFLKDGVLYLFSVRMSPVFPFFLINILMGLTEVKLFTFYWVSQLGMLIGTVVYVQAGVELAKITSLREIASPSLILALTLVALLPWLFKMLLNMYKNYKLYGQFKKPSHYQFNTVVIGAGAAGLISALISATVKAKVALIEAHKMGGDCLNYGCVPSKAIIKSAKVMHSAVGASDYGINLNSVVSADFKKIMSRVQSIIKSIEPNDSIERYAGLGVDCYTGKAKVISPFEVEVNNEILTTKNIIIASGAEPIVSDVAGIKLVNYLTSENLWKLDSLPENFLIIGGGAIGCELAQAFQRLGSKVILVDRAENLLSRSEKLASEVILKKLRAEGVIVHLNTELVEFSSKNSVKFKCAAELFDLEYSEVLFALGRRARVENSGLDVLNLEKNPNGTLKHNEYLQTQYPNVYVCGDVAGPIQLTHVAAHQAWFASVNAMFSPFKKFKADYSVIPSVVFTDPEVAQVGQTSAELINKGILFEETTYHISELDRALCEGEPAGFVKIITAARSDKILGATIVGSHAGELIAEISLAMKWKLGLNKILSTVHSYPTWSEALKMTAGQWRKKNKPDMLLRIVEKFHQLRRG